MRFNEDTGEFVLPLTINLTSEMLDEPGIYLMDLGDSLILYVRRHARPEEKSMLFDERPGERKMEVRFTERMGGLLSEINR